MSRKQQHVLMAKKAESILGYIRRSMVSSLRESVVSLYSTLVRLHQFGALQFKRDVEKLVRL